jgi:hypothetical protein
MKDNISWKATFSRFLSRIAQVKFYSTRLLYKLPNQKNIGVQVQPPLLLRLYTAVLFLILAYIWEQTAADL